MPLLYDRMDAKKREAIKASFQARPADLSVRILLGADAASEGIYLQNYCSHLIHCEIRFLACCWQAQSSSLSDSPTAQQARP